MLHHSSRASGDHQMTEDFIVEIILDVCYDGLVPGEAECI